MSSTPQLHIENLTINLQGATPTRIELGDICTAFKVPVRLEPPSIGAVWPEQGGIYAGIRQYPDGKLYHLIFSERDVGPHTWGQEGKNTEASDRSDGLANGGHLLNADGYFPAAMAAAEYLAGVNEEFDFYLPAISELSHAWHTIPQHLDPDKAYWSSTQHSAGYAFIVDSENGYHGGCVMTADRLVRPCRRLPVATAHPFTPKKNLAR